MGKIITAHDVLCQPDVLTDEQREKIRQDAKKLFAEALASAQRSIAAIEKEVRGVSKCFANDGNRKNFGQKQN